MSSTALIDCNNFFVSCERLFRPDLAKRPVVVLSSNDGCVISRSEEAKARGIKMGEPYFRIREQCEREGVAVFSSNFDLYRDLSRRVMETLRRFSDEVEVYSVDEAFLTRTCLKAPPALLPSSFKASPYNQYDSAFHSSAPRIRDLDTCSGAACVESNCEMYVWGTRVRETILREVGIPVSVGIAPTKTLSKVATHFAKHPAVGMGDWYGNGERRGMGDWYGNEDGRNSHEPPIPVPPTGIPGVCVLINESARAHALNLFPVEEVWGIGFRLAPKLKAFGIDTAGKLVTMDDQWVRKQMSIKGLTTVRELRGIPCYDVGEDMSLRKTLLHSQSFGTSVTDIADVRAAVAYHARKVAETLRTEQAAARSVSVVIRTSRHREKRYAAFDTDLLPTHTNSTFELVSQALAILTRIYRPGFPYAKAGVQVADIVPEDAVHPETLFGDTTGKDTHLMHTLDELRQRFGPDIVRMGAEGIQKKWSARHERLSPRYTTAWSDVPTIHNRSNVKS